MSRFILKELDCVEYKEDCVYDKFTRKYIYIIEDICDLLNEQNSTIIKLEEQLKEKDKIINGVKRDCEKKPSIDDFKNGIKILCVEDGSIDDQVMQQIRANLDGKVLVYRQGCKPPFVLEI